MPKANVRDAALLHMQQRLGETNGTISSTAMLRELRSAGQGYRKSDFLRDFAGIKGTPQTVKPGAIKGGIISGVVRSKDYKALPKDEQIAARKIAEEAIDITSETGESPYKKLLILSGRNGLVQFEAEASWEDVLDLPEDGVVGDNINLGSFRNEHFPVIKRILDKIYTRLT